MNINKKKESKKTGRKYQLPIKRMDRFMLETFLPILGMTFFICLFIVVMQFIWRYVDDLVGKGLSIPVLIEFLAYASLMMLPLALPLSLLLASLMTFGNLGERLELLAIKASGVSLFRIMRPVIIVVSTISVGAFFYQNDILPKVQVQLWTLMYSVRQKTPELDIPERTFYKEISGFNLYIESKNKKTGMLYDLMIYDFSAGFDNAMVIAADSGSLKFTPDKQFLIFTIYNGDSFENLKDQRSAYGNIPYRRENFSKKEILIPFDANFNRMDNSIFQNEYVGKNFAQLKTSIDSLTAEHDTTVSIYSQALRNSGYFGLYNYEQDTIQQKEQPSIINIDSLLKTKTPKEKENILTLSINQARSQKQEAEFRSATTSGQQMSIRRHEMEMHKKFTLSVACLIFFFIGAPLGAIIRKGGLGMPVVVSVGLFIFYFIFDNLGYKMAKNGNWKVWEGTWLSTFVLFPLGVFLTYKSVRDSAIFNIETYVLAIKQLFGKGNPREEFVVKNVIMQEIDIIQLDEMMNELEQLGEENLNQLKKESKNYWTFWFKNSLVKNENTFALKTDSLVDYLSNSQNQMVISKLSKYPVINKATGGNLSKHRVTNIIFGILFPLGIILYLYHHIQLRLMKKQLMQIKELNKEIRATISTI